MERVKQKMEQARKQRKQIQENTRIPEKDATGSRGLAAVLAHYSRYFPASKDVPLLLLGAAAGVAIIGMVWWGKSTQTAGDVNMHVPVTAGAADAGQVAGLQTRVSEIGKSSEDIALLDQRVKLLTGNIAVLEGKLQRVTALTDSLTDYKSRPAAAGREDKPVVSGTFPVMDVMDPTASGRVQRRPEAKQAFSPTHVVLSRLNLRPAATLDSKPIAVLQVGSKVEYISEADGWYYVNTVPHGKGWCASEYLASL